MIMKRLIKYSIILVSIAIVCCLVLFMLRRHTVLFTLNEAGSASEDPAFVVFNPFRDRTPEKIAEKFMQQLPSEHCMELVAPMRGDYAEHICSKEQQFVSKDFRLINRRDVGNSVELSFEVKRVNSPPSISRLTMQQVDRAWKVVDYQPVY